jgi:hypothetical protein
MAIYVAPYITGIHLAVGTNATVGFISIPGATHQFQYRDDLIAGSWLTQTNSIGGTGNIMPLLDTFATTQTQPFYRIQTTY